MSFGKIDKHNWKRCSVPLCDTHRPDGFHMLPKDIDQRNKWIEKCGLKKVNLSSRICSKHFNPSDYHKNKKLLKEGSIPSQLLPVRHFLSFIHGV